MISIYHSLIVCFSSRQQICVLDFKLFLTLNIIEMSEKKMVRLWEIEKMKIRFILRGSWLNLEV